MPLPPAARRLVARLSTPEAVQRWLDALPYNWERRGPTARTLRGVLDHGTAHCLEAALAAAAVLEPHGFAPLLLDLESEDRLDHVVFAYRHGARWGSVGRSRCPGLHGRHPVYPSLKALAASYMAPFIDTTGRLKGYGLLDLRTLPTGQWRSHPGNVPHVEEALRNQRHHRLPTPEATYRAWKARYDRWWDAAGRPEHGWPDVAFYAAAGDTDGWTRPEAPRAAGRAPRAAVPRTRGGSAAQ